MRDRNEKCALSCCQWANPQHEGKDGKFYCDEFCEADAATLADLRARDPSLRMRGAA